MALFINSGPEWHVGSEAVTKALNELARQPISALQADGDELIAIAHQFPSLMPNNNKRVVCWYGDTARFICANVKLHDYWGNR